MRRKIIIFAAKAGGGHMASAAAMKCGLEATSPYVDVEILDHWRILNLSYNTIIYNFCLRHNLIEIYERAIRPVLIFISAISFSQLWLHIPLAGFLRRQSQRPDVIVSNSPVLNGVIAKAMARAYGVNAPPFYIVFADFEDLRHPRMKFAIRPAAVRGKVQKIYYQCCSEGHISSVLGLGNSYDQIIKSTGIVINRSFSMEPIGESNRRIAKASLHLNPGLPVIYVGFGGYGNSLMLDIMKQAGRLKEKFNFIFVCGHNQDLTEKLRKHSQEGVHAAVFGYVPDPKPYLELSDYFVGKPGATSISEALALRVSPLILSTSCIMEQEQATLEYIQRKNLGRFFTSVESLMSFLGSDEAKDRKETFSGIEREPGNNGLEVAVKNILQLSGVQAGGA
jgi:hypothetical protein